MLVLTRKSRQIIDIIDEKGDVIAVITVIQPGPCQTKLGIAAPDNISINRREISERIARNDLVIKKDKVKKIRKG